MKYFKIILNNQIIGVITSDNFFKYQPITGCFLLSDEQNGEYLEYKGKTYRSTWMAPITHYIPYTTAIVTEITEEEYLIYMEAIDNNQTIEDETDPEPIPVVPYIDPDEQISIDFMRSSKINEMSHACRTTIESGIDVILHGEIKHFSLTTQDQLNLMGLNTSTGGLIPYHADGEEMTFYTVEEINQIISAANQLKNYNTAYFNSLKTYINALETIEDIAAITYGTPIPEEYKSDVLKVLE